jgi:dTDP-4-amino-4,6-dideoxygalactose transaminase
MKIHIPFVDLKSQYLSIKKEIDDAISNVITETAFIGGKYVKQFEEAFAEHYDVPFVISCANGTDSLYIIMKALGIGKGDEVITVANSWISSSETISQTGAKPVFIDIEKDYFSMDAGLVEDSITPNTKALILVHLQGQMADLEKISDICKRKNIYLIEDCAQSHFSEINGIKAGLTGIAASFSFYPGKNLGAYGDAGAIITSNKVLSEKMRMFANHGALVKHQHQMEGINSRLDGIQAAILTVKLNYINQWNDQRRQVAKWYSEALSNNTNILLPKERPGSKHTWHLYVILVKEREELMKFLRENGVETAIHYPTPLPLLPAYGYLGKKANDFPIASGIMNEILSLPIYPELSKDSVKKIAELIWIFYNN